MFMLEIDVQELMYIIFEKLIQFFYILINIEMVYSINNSYFKL